MAQTTLERKIGSAKIKSIENPTGPKGSRVWQLQRLNDNRVVVVGPDTHGRIPPQWLLRKIGACLLEKAGGTTYEWAAWIATPTQEG